MRTLQRGLVGPVVAGLLVTACGGDSGSPPAPPTPTSPAVTVGVISGVIVDAQSKQAVAGATVSTAPATATKQTDGQGRYVFESVAPGSYVVIAAKSGYVEQRQNVTVAAGATAIADLTLTAVALSYNGKWAGTTSRQQRFNFTVTNNIITDIEVGYLVPGCQGFLAWSPNVAVNAAAFRDSITDALGKATSTVRGSFGSGTSASGTAKTVFRPVFSTDCSGTDSASWTAVRSP
jgi:hypothetical protein